MENLKVGQSYQDYGKGLSAISYPHSFLLGFVLGAGASGIYDTLSSTPMNKTIKNMVVTGGLTGGLGMALKYLLQNWA